MYNDIMCASCGCAHRQAGHPYDFMGCQKSLIGLPFAPAEQHLSELTASHFYTLNKENCKPECAGKDSHCHAKSEQG